MRRPILSIGPLVLVELIGCGTKPTSNGMCVWNQAYQQNTRVDDIATVLDRARDCYVLVDVDEPGVTEAIVTTVPITPSDFAVTAVFCGFMCIVCFVRIALLVTARVESVSFFHLAPMFMFVTIGCCLIHPMRCAGRMTGVPSKTLASAFRVMRRFCGVPVGFVLSHFEGGVES